MARSIVENGSQEFVDILKLKPDEKVLDVGCGIGGGDFYMAEKYGVYVHGIDLSVNMVLIALERASKQVQSKVRTWSVVLHILHLTVLSASPLEWILACSKVKKYT